ncbi:hypothetical protein AB8Z38_32465 [Bradyrhizobium sp. LLZ17]|uniref:Uncharacterized protein n=1 Tax=Bradyrhizobium sp. LLZ17 TaxID=3239388 RepID=A0AB39XH95_9BRAD
MLPGFRFLLAAILLSASILVFGLGAAALLRATHEQYVSNPSWRNGPQEQVFAQAPEPAQPVLAALRVEQVTPAADDATPALRDQVPSIGMPAVETAPEQMAAVTLDGNVQPEPRVAALGAAIEAAPPATEAPAPEPAKSEPAQSEAAASAPADTLTPADTTASIATMTPAPAAIASELPRTATALPASHVADIAAARMAALNELAPAKTLAPKAKAAGTTPESKPRAHKPKKRHRIVRRPPPPPVQQALDPFTQQPTLAAAATTRKRQ